MRRLAILLIPLMVGCIVVEDGGGRFDPVEGPGTTPWNHDDDISCTSNADCSQGEVCEDQVCQMARCGETYSSTAPMGDNHFFGTDGELAVVSDDFFIDGFESTDGKYLNSWDLQNTSKVIDVAGGNLHGKRPHTIAVAIDGSDKVLLNGPEGLGEINVGMWPKALAIGDVDADGIDELVAFGANGDIALCQVDKKKCSSASIDGVQGKDVAVADVDGDGFAEAIFLLEYSDKTDIIVWNTDADTTGQEQTVGWQLNFPVRAISAGDTNGNGVAEVAALEDGGWWGWKDDKVHLFSPATEQIILTKGVYGHTVDVAVGDRDSDDKAEVAILREDNKLELFKFKDSQLSSMATFPLAVGEAAQRISFIDWNGDSASGKLLSGPELIAGRAVPIAALMFPPYPRDFAAGSFSANVTLGNNESTSQSLSDTLTLSLGLTVSYGAETPLFKAKVGAYFGKDFSYTKTVTKSQTVGQRFWVVADPELHGSEYAAVVLSCGCFHRYRYVTEDPGNKLGGSGQELDVFVPVGGQTMLWSSKRYNAMAKSLGTLPVIEVPVRVGDMSSYPEQLQTIDGQPIPSQDLLFPNTPTFQSSDVGFVGFWLVNGQQESNAFAETTKLGVNGSLGVGGLSVDSELGIGVTQGYSITVGKDTIFAGGVPPIPDDPETPEDEYQLHRYSFTPTVYRQHYTDSAGEDAAYYVLTYAVGK